MSAPHLAENATALKIRGILFVLLVITVSGITFSIALSSIAMGIAIAGLIFYWLQFGKEGFTRTPLDFFFIAYVVAEGLSTVFSVDPIASLVNMKRLFLISVFYVVVLCVDSEQKLKIALGILVFVASTLTVVELFSLSSVGGHFLRISFFQYYLTEAGIKMFVALMMLPFLFHPSTPMKWRIPVGCAEVVLLLGLVITQTRSAWLGFLSGTIAIASLRYRKLFIAIAAVIVAFMLFAPQDFKSRAESIVDPTMTSNLTRIHMITTGWKMFLDYPLFGTGDIDLKKLYVTYITPIDEAEGGHLHNNLMMLLVTLGLVGFGVTAAIFIKIFMVELSLARTVREHWLSASAALGSFAAYVGFHISGLFEWNFGDHEIAVFLWFSLGVAFVAGRFLKSGGAIVS